MKTIYKYPLSTTGGAHIDVPKGGVVRGVGVQSSTIMLWIEVDTDEEEHELRTFHFFDTGHPIPTDVSLHHHGIAFDHQLGRVWHVYEQTK